MMPRFPTHVARGQPLQLSSFQLGQLRVRLQQHAAQRRLVRVPVLQIQRRPEVLRRRSFGNVLPYLYLPFLYPCFPETSFPFLRVRGRGSPACHVP